MGAEWKIQFEDQDGVLFQSGPFTDLIRAKAKAYDCVEQKLIPAMNKIKVMQFEKAVTAAAALPSLDFSKDTVKNLDDVISLTLNWANAMSEATESEEEQKNYGSVAAVLTLVSEDRKVAKKAEQDEILAQMPPLETFGFVDISEIKSINETIEWVKTQLIGMKQKTRIKKYQRIITYLNELKEVKELIEEHQNQQ